MLLHKSTVSSWPKFLKICSKLIASIMYYFHELFILNFIIFVNWSCGSGLSGCCYWVLWILDIKRLFCHIRILWTLDLQNLSIVRSWRSWILFFVSWWNPGYLGSWFFDLRLDLGDPGSFFCFVLGSWESWILIYWSCSDILLILDLDILCCGRILWILDHDFWLRHMSACHCVLLSRTSRLCKLCFCGH